jgi:hypothetical protein
MPAPPRSFLTVTDIAIRWQIPALGIAGWTIDGKIALSAVLPTVYTADKQIASGIRGSTAPMWWRCPGATARGASQRWSDARAVRRNPNVNGSTRVRPTMQ